MLKNYRGIPTGTMNLVRYLLCCCRRPAKGDDFHYEVLDSYDENLKPSAPITPPPAQQPIHVTHTEPPSPLPLVGRETMYASPFVLIKVMTKGDDTELKIYGGEKEESKTEPKRLRGEPTSTDTKIGEKAIRATVANGGPVPLEGGTPTLPWSVYEPYCSSTTH